MLFNVNIARDSGGSIVTVTSNITFEGNAVVTFSNKHADRLQGGAISFVLNSVVTITGNAMVMFYNNSVNGFGGAVTCHDSTIMLHENSSVTFNDN